MKLKQAIELATPPAVIHLAKRLRHSRLHHAYGLSGDYHNWDEALAASTGYDNNAIVEKTKTSLLEVKNGRAAYERDSVLFDKVEYNWPALACLMWIAASYRGTINVLDFGGSLGSTYFQNQAFLSSLSEVRWNIVEQSRHVEIGKSLFEDHCLRFYVSIADCLAETKPNVVLLSSVLQYLERPYSTLEQIVELPCDYIIIDRTPFWIGPSDRLCVQNVPPTIYSASYPSWIFSQQQFYEYFHEKWRVMVTFDNPDRLLGPVKFSYQGVVFVRQNLS